jgi:beta-lactam-binding protein with PASTA domain
MINKQITNKNLLGKAICPFVMICIILFSTNLNGAKMARVPKINGMNFEQAVQKLKRAGFNYKIKRYQYVLPKNPEGKVCYVYPTGSQPIGTTINFAYTKHWKSTGRVPAISGMYLRSAYIKVAGHGYKFKVRGTKSTSDYRKRGKVYDPIPVEGTKLKSGSTVSVIKYK